MRSHKYGEAVGTPKDDFVYLGEALDALDRLYDEKSVPNDVRAILRIAGMALSDRALGGRLVAVATDLSRAMREARPTRLTTEAALAITDIVRDDIAGAWQDLWPEHHQ